MHLGNRFFELSASRGRADGTGNDVFRRRSRRGATARAGLVMMFAIVALGCCAHSRASLINAQFVPDDAAGLDWAAGGPFSGAAAVGAEGDYWNAVSGDSFTNGAPFNLVDSGQAATPVVAQAYTDFYYERGPLPPTFGGTPYARLMGQYAYSNSREDASGLIILSHLDPGLYDLYLYSAGAYDGQTRVTQFVANDVEGLVGPNAFMTSLLPGVNYLHLQPTIGSGGVLSIGFQGTVSDAFGVEGDFNGFQLIPAPEPGSAALLLVLGGVGLLVCRRRSGGRTLFHPHRSSLQACMHSGIASIESSAGPIRVFRRGAPVGTVGTLAGLVFAFVVFVCCAHSQASLINAQFVSLGEFITEDNYGRVISSYEAPVWSAGGPFSGAAAIGSDGDYWNTIAGNSVPGSGQFTLADTTQAPTPVVAQTFVTGYWSDSLPEFDPTFDGTPYARLMRQYTYSIGNTLIVLSHLDPGLYDLYLYSVGASDGQMRVTNFVANNVHAIIGPNAGATTLVAGVNYLHIQPTVGSNGLLSLEFQGSVSDARGIDEGDLNGFQLVPAPEPGSVALFLAGSFGLLIRRRSFFHPAKGVAVGVRAL